MLPRVACCQGTNLRAWITLVVLIQCALILLYWDATRGGTSSSKSFRLQAKASRDHLRAQSGAAVPEVTLRHFPRQSSQDETQVPTSKEVGGNRDGNFKRSNAAPDRKLTFSEDHGSKSKQEVARGRLISPETELLLYRRPKKRKYSGLSDTADELARESMQKQGVVHFAKDEKGRKISNRTNGDSARHIDIGKVESGVKVNQTGIKIGTTVAPHAMDNNQVSTGKNLLINSTASTFRATSVKNPNPNIPSVTALPGVLNSTGQTIPGLNKVYANYKKYELDRVGVNKSPTEMRLSVPSVTPATKTDINRTQTIKALRTDVMKDSETKHMYSSSTTHLFNNDFANQEQPQPLTTRGIKLSKLHQENQQRPRPTFDKPLPSDPYSFDPSNFLYKIGTKEEFQEATPDLPDVFRLPQGEGIEDKYFVRNGGEACFREGTALNNEPEDLGRSFHTGCLCKRGWHGHQCSIPEMVFSSTGARFVELLKPRTTARRVISALAFNVEFELLEARLHELDDVIDVFIILESNYTNYGEPKPLHLLKKLRDGYLKEFHHKIVYLFRGRIPKGGRDDGWLVDQHMRMYIGQEGMRRVSNTAPDDIFLYTDADEIPNRQSILFLRMHDGYSEPFGVSLRWSVFGFFWKQIEPTRVLIGCTVGMFRYVFNNDAYQLRSTDYQNQASDKLHAYIASGAHIYDWHMGDNGVLSGWHCSWCLPPSRIRIKLTSAINADFPRWGDFPEKLEIPYLRNLVKTGTWFDDKTRFGMLVNSQNEEAFAPQYLLNNLDKFPYLLNLEDA